MVALTITINGEKSEARIIKKMHERVIKSFMDTIIMAELQNGPISGYDEYRSYTTNSASSPAQAQSTPCSIRLSETD